MLRSETSYSIVLVKPLEQEWIPCGEMVVPKHTARMKVRELLLEGQGARDGVPQIPLEPEEYGEILIVPTEELGEPIPVRARAAVLIEPTTAAPPAAPEEEPTAPALAPAPAEEAPAEEVVT